MSSYFTSRVRVLKTFSRDMGKKKSPSLKKKKKNKTESTAIRGKISSWFEGLALSFFGNKKKDDVVIPPIEAAPPAPEVQPKKKRRKKGTKERKDKGVKKDWRMKGSIKAVGVGQTRAVKAVVALAREHAAVGAQPADANTFGASFVCEAWG